MRRLPDKQNKDVALHRWLGLRPVDFVRAAERRAAVLLRRLSDQLNEQSTTRQRRPQPSGAKRHYPLSAIRYPLSQVRYPLSALRYPLFPP